MVFRADENQPALWVFDLHAFGVGPTLVAHVFHSATPNVLDQSADDAAGWLLETITEVVGAPCPEPVATAVTSWANDPFARGAYTHVPVGADPAWLDLLGRTRSGVASCSPASTRRVRARGTPTERCPVASARRSACWRDRWSASAKRRGPLRWTDHRLESARLVLGQVHQPVAVGPDQGIAAYAVPAVQAEDDPPLVAVVLLPPACVGDELVLVGVVEMVEVVVLDGDGQPVLAAGGRQSTGTAQDRSTPSSSSRRSKCGWGLRWSCSTNAGRSGVLSTRSRYPRRRLTGSESGQRDQVGVLRRSRGPRRRPGGSAPARAGAPATAPSSWVTSTIAPS